MEIWGTIAAVVLVGIVLALVVDRRRGSTGASRSLDVTHDTRGRSAQGGQHGPMAGGGGSAGDGVGGDGGGGS